MKISNSSTIHLAFLLMLIIGLSIDQGFGFSSGRGHHHRRHAKHARQHSEPTTAPEPTESELEFSEEEFVFNDSDFSTSDEDDDKKEAVKSQPKPVADEDEDSYYSFDADDSLIQTDAQIPRIRIGAVEFNNCVGCPAGWGLVRRCDPDKNQPKTICQVCPPHTWSPNEIHFSPCKPCAACGDNLYVHKECSASADTQCGWCDNPRGDRFNLDYIRKCEPLSVPLGHQEDAERKFEDEVEEMVNVRDHIPDDSDPHHQLWQEHADSRSDNIQRKPSYHSYDLPSVTAAGHQHRKTAYILLIVAVLLTTLAIGLTIMVIQHRLCSDSARAHQQRLYVALTNNDDRIIEECARHLPGGYEDLGGGKLLPHGHDGFQNPLENFQATAEDLKRTEMIHKSRSNQFID